LDKAIGLGADFIATGHYSKIAAHPDSGRLCIVSSGATKDQSYALYSLTQQQLERTMFPIGDMPKDEVRRIAAEQVGLRVAYKPDSQEICFIPDNNHSRFLEEHFARPLAGGNFVDEDGNVLGRHLGIGHYTIGQRKGLGKAFGRPVYVKEIDASGGNVVLSDEAALFSREMTVGDVNFMAFEDFEEMKCFGKIRYSHKAAGCVVWRDGDVLRCRFDEAQRAITPRQSAVFYDDAGRIICGGVIL